MPASALSAFPVRLCSSIPRQALRIVAENPLPEPGIEVGQLAVRLRQPHRERPVRTEHDAILAEHLSGELQRVVVMRDAVDAKPAQRKAGRFMAGVETGARRGVTALPSPG